MKNALLLIICLLFTACQKEQEVQTIEPASVNARFQKPTDGVIIPSINTTCASLCQRNASFLSSKPFIIKVDSGGGATSSNPYYVFGTNPNGGDPRNGYFACYYYSCGLSAASTTEKVTNYQTAYIVDPTPYFGNLPCTYKYPYIFEPFTLHPYGQIIRWQYAFYNGYVIGAYSAPQYTQW